MSESDGPTREASALNLTHEHPSTFQSFTQRINSAIGSFRDKKNKQDHASVLSGLSGLRVGSKGQLEVDKSIWDLTKGVHVEEQQVSATQRAWESVRTDAKTVVTTVRRDPAVALIPLFLLLVLLGGGLWAVYASAAQETKHRRAVAQQVVRDKALYLETELAKAFMPAYVCSVYVRRDPSWPAVNGSFAPMAMEMIRLSKAGSVLTLSLIPNGVIYTMVPLLGSSPADDLNWRAIGKDWLQDKYNQDKVLQAISSRNLTIIGPYNLTQGGIGLVAMLSINIANSSAAATFDTPPYVHGSLGPWQTPPRTQTGPNLTDTPYAPYMYDQATATKWWGLTTVLISWDVLREDVTRLEELGAQGYQYVLARPVLRKELLQARPDLANGSHELAVAWSDGVQRVPLNATNNRMPPRRPGGARPLVYYDLHERLVSPVFANVSVEGAQLTLYAQLGAGWSPSWRTPMAAVTVLLSCVLAALLFLVLVNRRQHMRLLHAMIPKKVVSTLRRGKVFTESFEVVTVLFSDIVSYTTMSAQMAPIEVVQMLDELYVEFDNLAEKHKLYKLDTIGDAFMLVGGAPESDVEGAAAAAARVAQMSLDMIRTTSTKVLAGGHVVKIRVGIHSGPAVAAVVGRKAPKYTLFGDTVNTASRMESNGSPMRIHVSGATAALLGQAGGFVIEPRGEIPVKGKGVMSTFWVTGTHAWLEGPCPRSEAVDISSLHGPATPAAVPFAEKTKDSDRSVFARQQPPQHPQPSLQHQATSGALSAASSATAAAAAGPYAASAAGGSACASVGMSAHARAVASPFSTRRVAPPSQAPPRLLTPPDAPNGASSPGSSSPTAAAAAAAAAAATKGFKMQQSSSALAAAAAAPAAIAEVSEEDVAPAVAAPAASGCEGGGEPSSSAPRAGAQLSSKE